MQQHKEYNKYDKLLFCLILSGIIGQLKGLFLIPLYFSFLLNVYVITHSEYLFKRKAIKCVWYAFTIMILYSVCSLLWTPVLGLGFSALLLQIRNVTFFLAIFILSFRAKESLITISNAWTFAFALTAIIALWEILTDSHLSVARESLDESFLSAAALERHTASVTFYNPNTYCVFCAMSLPFMLFRLSFLNDKKWRIFQIFLTFILVFIMFMNGSRGGVLCTVIIFSVYFTFNLSSNRKRNTHKTIYLFLIFIIAFFLFSDILLQAILSKLDRQGMLEDSARTTLWDSSWHLFLESKGFGQGIGSMRYCLSHDYSNYTDIVYSHNLFLELLLEGGVIFGFLFLLYVWGLFKYNMKLNSIEKKWFFYAVLLSLPFCSVINSIYMAPIFIWNYFASVLTVKYACNHQT